jgi:glutathionylspermidine synthase
MQRIAIEPRRDWKKKVEELGLLFHTLDDKPYWHEAAYYRFTASEVDVLERATNELHEMCLKAVDYVIDNNRFRDLAIPDAAIEPIKVSWETEPPAIYGRFDFGYDGFRPPKLLEYNADTPTALLEAAVVQWHWLQELFPDADQFNSIWEGLVEKWAHLKDGFYLKGGTLHCAHMDNIEDLMTVTVIRDAAQEAGLTTEGILMRDIGWDSKSSAFVDLKGERMKTIFKLYPWEWLISDSFGSHVLEKHDQVQWMEPMWKMILSNKGILAILWEMYPGHPYLLESYIGRSRDLREYVKKPLLSREGANVMVKAGGALTRTGGEYGEEGFVFQDYFALPNMNGNFPVLGSWVIDDTARGMGIRESDGPVTDNWSRFVPHLFE